MINISAVLTGDLVGSTKASPKDIDVAMQCVANCFEANNLFTRFRGDGWQVYLENGGKGLHAMVRVAASLRSQNALSSRISLGLGEAVVNHDLATAHGDAFVASGRGLSGMSKASRFSVGGKMVTPTLIALVELIDQRIQSWSREQAEAASVALKTIPSPTQQEMADHLGISRQALASRFASAGFAKVLSAAWAFYTEFHGRSWTDA